jgi:hypothetical protein
MDMFVFMFMYICIYMNLSEAEKRGIIYMRYTPQLYNKMVYVYIFICIDKFIYVCIYLCPIVYVCIH